jgi:hypothetical protein
LPHCNFVHHKSHMTRPGLEPGPPGGKPVTNRLSYDAVSRLKIQRTKYFIPITSCTVILKKLLVGQN